MTDTLGSPKVFLPHEPMDTQVAAAEVAAHSAANGEALVMEALRRAQNEGYPGLTDKQLEEWTGLGPNSARPRRIGLMNKGLVEDSGYRFRPYGSNRDMAVWRVKPC